MKHADSNIALMRGISVLALMLFASGCGKPMEASHVVNSNDIPLLVRFEDRCPKEVIETVAGCAVPPSAKDPNKPDEVPVCRKPNEKIIWFAVTGATPPYQADANLPDFQIVSKIKDQDDPTEKQGGGQCKESRNGVLNCKIKGSTESGTVYDYSVVAGDCSLDPRIYVP
jgi:hypothetical protein